MCPERATFRKTKNILYLSCSDQSVNSFVDVRNNIISITITLTSLRPYPIPCSSLHMMFSTPTLTPRIREPNLYSYSYRNFIQTPLTVIVVLKNRSWVNHDAYL